jgi:hypothetical protein
MRSDLFGLLAEFHSLEALQSVIDRARAAGYRQVDAYTPWPVEGLGERLDRGKTGMAPAVLAGGIIGGLAGYAMQFYTMAVDYPINVGGRPLHSWPAFIAITFEMTVLGAALSGFAALLVLNRLPRLHHPLFNIERFERASIDGFFLSIEATDPCFGEEETRTLLRESGAITIWELEK